MTTSSEERIAQLEAELVAMRAEMQTFTYTVSHDLRAPLRHIVSFARLVQEEAGPQLGVDVQGFLQTISDSARHMGVLLDGLTALSRAGTVALNPSTVNLQSLLEDVRLEWSGARSLESLQWQIADDIPHVLADGALLRQALEQVLGNAVKFSGPRSLAKIDISADSQASGLLCLRVQDNGVGFNPDHQGKLFQVFGRLHSASEFPGIGLGLALSRKILQRLDGAIAIESAIDGGCSVRLELPMA
jgi:light-regulated signal transduction histidine kinase (bacteriophytochrome)